MNAYCLPTGLLTLANAPVGRTLEVRGVVGRELHSRTLLPGTWVQVVGCDCRGVRVQLGNGSVRLIDPRLASLIRVEIAGTETGGTGALPF